MLRKRTGGRRGRSIAAITTAAFALALSLACGGGSGSSGTGSGPGGDAAPAGPATVALGTPIVVEDGSATASVVLTKVEANAKSHNQFDKSERGQFFAISVEITATKGASDIGPSNFRFIGNDGTVYQTEFVVGITPQLDAMTEIQQSQKKVGKVVFDCEPAKVAGGKIQLSDDGGDPVGYWTF